MNKEIIIQEIIDKIKAQHYLEIGVEKGKHFFKIKAPHKIAVDPHFRIKFLLKLRNIRDYFRSRFIEKTSDDFFEEDAPEIYSGKTIDVAFIDGLHTFEQSLRDFENCLNYLSPAGVILLHDCNPLSPEEGAPTQSPKEMYALYPNRKSNDWTGEVWKTILYLQSIPEFEVFVLDCDHGVGVVKKTIGSLPKQSLSRDQIDKLTYEDLDKNRTAFLNLKQPQYIHKFLKTCSFFTA